MTLSKKHFEAIAKMLGENTKANNKLIIEFALYFKSINPNFNKDKFIDAINKSRELKKADEVYYDHKFDLRAKQVIAENEKHLLKKLEEANSPMEFTLFKEDNNPNNFSKEFHKKFDELENQVIYNQQLKKGTDL
jgi:hypothetical protein